MLNQKVIHLDDVTREAWRIYLQIDELVSNHPNEMGDLQEVADKLMETLFICSNVEILDLTRDLDVRIFEGGQKTL